MKYDFDLIVLGGGSAGFVGAKLASGLGKKVLLVENNHLGGECSYSGCIPSKALIQAARISNSALTSSAYSLNLSYASHKSNPLSYVQAIINKVALEHSSSSLTDYGIKLIMADPQIIDSHTVLADSKTYTTRYILLATGSSPSVPPINGINDIPFLTNDSFFQLPALPSSLIILGGGPIGVELAQACNRLGVKVHLIEMASTLLPREDPLLTKKLSSILSNEGIHIHTSTKALTLSHSGNKINVLAQQNGKNITISSETILLALGRTSNSNIPGLKECGVSLQSSVPLVNAKLQTSVKSIYAAGDVIGPYQFSHMAEYQARLAVSQMFLPFQAKASYENKLWITFTDPELAHLGASKIELETSNIPYTTHTYPYSSLDRAKTDMEEEGLIQILTSKKGKILGADILGAHAGELIHEIQLLKTFGIKLSKLQSVLHAYPSYSDGIRQLGKAAYISSLQNNPFIKLIQKFRKG